MSGKIEKIIVRLQSKIEAGDFYEAQQQTRVVAARYIKTQDYSSATDILYSVSQSLLKANQGGSGGDLSLFLVDVYGQAELQVDSTNKGRLLTLLRLFDSEEPTRKKFITEIIAWSAKYSEYPAGDPELHHVVGSLYAEEHESYEAEKHLAYGTKDSAEIFARMEYEWYMQDDLHTAAQYAARVVFPYLMAGNVRDASKALRFFTTQLSNKNKNLTVQDIETTGTEVKIYPSLPLLNFLSLLLMAITKGTADVYRQLRFHYATHTKEVPAWDEALEGIAEMYFGISRPRQGNPLMDMMGSMFGGGMPQQRQSTPRRVIGAPKPSIGPPAEGLD